MMDYSPNLCSKFGLRETQFCIAVPTPISIVFLLYETVAKYVEKTCISLVTNLINILNKVKQIKIVST